MARDDANIPDFKDLQGKRVNLGDPGSGNRSTMELLMKEYGWTPATFKLATDLKPRQLAAVTRTIGFDALPTAFDDFIHGRVKGRTVVRIGG